MKHPDFGEICGRTIRWSKQHGTPRCPDCDKD